MAIYFFAGLLLAYSIFPEIGLTHDSRFYLKAGEDLLKLGFDQTTFQIWPPLFPIIIFLLGNNLTLIAIFNILCWMVTMYLCFRYILKEVQLPALHQNLLVVGVAFSTPLFLVHSFVWSEAPFIVCAFALIISTRYEGRYQWVIQSLLAVALVGLRHSGVIVIAGCFLAIAMQGRFTLRALPWVVISATFFLFWQWYASIRLESVLSVDYLKSVDLYQNYNYLSTGLVPWLVPVRIPAIAFLFPLLWATLIIWMMRHSRDIIIACWGTVSLLSFLVALISANLLFEDIERYLVITHPLFVLSIIKWTHSLRLRQRHMVNFMLFAFTLYSVFRTAKNAFLWHQF